MIRLARAIAILLAPALAAATPGDEIYTRPGQPLDAALVQGVHDPFVGKWRLDVSRSTIVDQMRVQNLRPNRYRFNFEGSPAETVVADGTDQPGPPGTTLSVKAVDARTLIVERKRGGHVFVSAAWKLSQDGRALRDDFTSLQPDGSRLTVHYLYKRMSGTSGFAGAWESTTKPMGLKIELEIQPYGNKGLSFVSPGSDKRVTFDGRDHAVPGAKNALTLSGRRRGARAMEYTEKIRGKVERARQFELARDGGTLTETLRTAGQTTPDVFVFAREQTNRVFALRVNDASPGKMPALAQAPAPGRSFRDCSNGCPEMVVVPKGRFTMGAPAGEEERENLPNLPGLRGRSVPQHLVTIRHKFAIGRFDVTRDEYAQFVAETHRPDPDSCITANPSGPGFITTNGNQHSQGIPQTTGGPAVCGTCITVGASGNDFITTNGNWHSPGFPQTGRDPVVCVGWNDAKAYVAWLSAKTGHVYRLPTEAEWEYAARAGTTAARYGSDNPAELCRYTNVADADYRRQHPSDSGGDLACRDGYAFTSPVGSFPPNRHGLYDMLGDVMDWTEDCWNINYIGAPSDGTAWLTGDCGRRVVHGGSWDADLSVVRSAMRRGVPTFYRNTTFGFRVARTL